MYPYSNGEDEIVAYIKKSHEASKHILRACLLHSGYNINSGHICHKENGGAS